MLKKKVNLHITNKCNFKCAHCFGKFSPTDLRFKDWKKVSQRTNDLRLTPLKSGLAAQETRGK